MVLLPETDAYGGAIVAERLGAAVRDTAGADRAAGGDRRGRRRSRSPSRSASPSTPSTAPPRSRCWTPPTTRSTRPRRPGRDTYRLAEPVGRATEIAAFRPAYRERAFRSAPPAARPAGRSRRGRAAADSLAACPGTIQRRCGDPNDHERARDRPPSGQGRHPGGRPGHPVPAGHQGRARRSCCRSSTGRCCSTSSRRRPRPASPTCCWSPGAARPRWSTTSTGGPTWRPGWRRRATWSGSPRSADQRARRDLHLPAGRAARPRPRGRHGRLARRRQRRSRCCSATSSSRRPSRCCRRCSTCRPDRRHRAGVHGGDPRGDLALRHRLGRPAVRRCGDATSSR